jgi:dTDP-4-amino-4,6-dideoxygalactose transaminase
VPLALAAVGLEEGEQVIVPTLTFVACAEVVCYMKGIPRFVDVDPRTLTIDVNQVAELLEGCREGGPPFRAIIPVHFGGFPCDMDALMEVARCHGVAVIDDAAHALPSLHKGRMIGTIGDITAFSFYATKSITAGEGGMSHGR